MKHMILATTAAVLLVGCTEKTEVAMRVFRDRAENRLIALAGEAEVATELYRNQYATLKERLVRMKALQLGFSESIERAYAANDPRRINMYEARVKELNEKIPQAEKTLREFYEIYQTQRTEIQYIKDEISTYKAMGMTSDTLEVTSSYERRADHIKELTNSLRAKAKRAQALMQVGEFEGTFTTR